MNDKSNDKQWKIFKYFFLDLAPHDLFRVIQFLLKMYETIINKITFLRTWHTCFQVDFEKISPFHHLKHGLR